MPEPKDPILHVKITIFHKDPKILVKYFVPLSLASEWVTSEIAYASIARKRIKHTEFERGQMGNEYAKMDGYSRCGIWVNHSEQ